VSDRDSLSSKPTGLKRFVIPTITYSLVLVVTLVLFDVACIVLGIFPPPRNPGDPDLGWRASRVADTMQEGVCLEFSTGETIRYQRNEDGIRTSLRRADTTSGAAEIRIAVTGDSHTELCAPNEQLHSGYLASQLRDLGVPAVALTYGVGRYSPLQDYLAFRTVLKPYRPDVLILNLYTGNDFYDQMRMDDRPHFVRADTGYRIAPPVWYTLDAPGTVRRSRVFALARTLGDRTGIRTAVQRYTYLRATTAEQGASLGSTIGYMRRLLDARDPSLGYPDALTAQMLNQQLFFNAFNGTLAESLRRIEALLTLARRENPDVILVLSAIPSYQLVGETPIDSAMHRAAARTGFSIEAGIAQEQSLYDSLSGMATRAGWLFADNLVALRAERAGTRLYNDFDYHLLPRASEIIGRTQRAVLDSPIRERLAARSGSAATSSR
jgi:hypothetical protein